MKKTAQNNKLIAEFMGMKNVNWFVEDVMLEFFKKVPKNIELSIHNYTSFAKAYTVSELKYHKSWDLLMPVVEKIEETKLNGRKIAEVKIDWCICSIKMDSMGKKHESFNGACMGECKIDAVYYAVVCFIDWYNQQKNAKNKKT